MTTSDEIFLANMDCTGIVIFTLIGIPIIITVCILLAAICSIGNMTESEWEAWNKHNELKKKGIPSCHKCGSTYVSTISESSGWPITIHKRYNICQFCGHKERIC